MLRCGAHGGRHGFSPRSLVIGLLRNPRAQQPDSDRVRHNHVLSFFRRVATPQETAWIHPLHDAASEAAPACRGLRAARPMNQFGEFPPDAARLFASLAGHDARVVTHHQPGVRLIPLRRGHDD